MKKTLKFLSILLVSTNLIYTADRITIMDREKTYKDTKKSIDKLSREGNLKSSFAVMHFYTGLPQIKQAYSQRSDLID